MSIQMRMRPSGVVAPFAPQPSNSVAQFLCWPFSSLPAILPTRFLPLETREPRRSYFQRASRWKMRWRFSWLMEGQGLFKRFQVSSVCFPALSGALRVFYYAFWLQRPPYKSKRTEAKPLRQPKRGRTAKPIRQPRRRIPSRIFSASLANKDPRHSADLGRAPARRPSR